MRGPRRVEWERLPSRAVERDPLVATLAEANAELAGLDTFINVHVGDLTQHVDEVLGESGFAPAEIAGLRERGVVA